MQLFLQASFFVILLICGTKAKSITASHDENAYNCAHHMGYEKKFATGVVALEFLATGDLQVLDETLNRMIENYCVTKERALNYRSALILLYEMDHGKPHSMTDDQAHQQKQKNKGAKRSLHGEYYSELNDLIDDLIKDHLSGNEKLDDGTDFKEQMQILLEHLSKIDANESISQKEIHLLIDKIEKAMELAGE